MKTNLEKEITRIANAIVGLVERTDGPVTLARVQQEIAGFAKHAPPAWGYGITHSGRVISFWDDMTEAGAAALRKVIRERRVAIQFVSVLRYLLDGYVIKDEDWQPIVLLPARAANVDSQNWYLRVPQKMYEHFARQAAEGKTNLRLLTPHYVGATADGFFDVNTREDAA